MDKGRELIEKHLNGESLTGRESLALSQFYEGQGAYMMYRTLRAIGKKVIPFLMVCYALGAGSSWLSENTKLGRRVSSKIEVISSSNFMQGIGQAGRISSPHGQYTLEYKEKK